MIGTTLVVLIALMVALFGGSIIAPGRDHRWDTARRRRE
jgi:hypothetical protein